MSLSVWYLSYGLSGLGGPTRNISSAGIARKVIEARRPPHCDKVETFGGVKGVVFKQVINPVSLESTKKPECVCMFGAANFKAVKM